MPGIIDTHAHINYPDFSDNIDNVLSDCEELGVEKIIAIATDLKASEDVIQLSEKYDPIYAVVGCHPCDALNAPDDIRTELKQMAKNSKVVAIGETGLDYYRMPSQMDESKSEADDSRYIEKQAHLFEQQIEVAIESNLNLVIHQRSAFDETMKYLQPLADKVKGVFHCFVGSPEQQKMVEAMGSLVSFTGIVTFKNAEEVRVTVEATPIDKLMVETDCPYLAPVPFRGKKCYPHHVFHVAKTIAQIKGTTIDELADITTNTAHHFFKGLKG